MASSTGTTSIPAHFADVIQQREAALLGIWIFLATEVLLFGSLFLGYIVARAGYPEAFGFGSRHLHLWMGALNTAVLLTSGFTMALAVHFGGHRRKNLVLAGLIVTAFLALAFLVIHGSEYWQEYKEGLMPLAGMPFHVDSSSVKHVRLFFALYVIMTFIHAVHVFIGFIILSFFSFLVWCRGVDDQTQRRIEICGLYWAFVDIVWIFLFPSLYLVAQA